jgi:hypothetical protein
METNAIVIRYLANTILNKLAVEKRNYYEFR